MTQSRTKLPPTPRAPRRIPELTDLGNAERFATLHRKHARYCPAFRSWLIFDGRRWRKDDSFAAERLAVDTVRSWPDVLSEWSSSDGFEDLAKAVSKHTKRSQSSGAIRATLDLARAQPGMCVNPEQLDSDPWLLNCLSGTIDLRTGRLRPHSPADLITRLAPVQYDPTARNATWDQFVSHVSGGDVEFRTFLQRAAGYCLTGVNTEKCFFFAFSRLSNTGKSTYLDALKATMGDYAMTSSPVTWLKQPIQSANMSRGDLARLRGARLVTASEFDEDARFDEGLIKSITGGDEVTVREVFQESFTYKPQFKILIAANFAPRFTASDEAMVFRTRRMPFIHVAQKLDPKVRETLVDPSEAGSAILAWAVAGCLDWQRHGMPVPELIRRSNEAYRIENDPAHGFFQDVLEFGDPSDLDYRISRKQLREAYEEWCRDEGVRHPLGPKKLHERLRERGCREAAVNGTRYWDGVRRVISAAEQSRFSRGWEAN